MDNFKLTIAIITMNRALQVKKALESCLSSELPKDTQFVVVDNGSLDNTQEVVNEIKSQCPWEFIYHRETENRGAGEGRNICYSLSKGEYIYFLDDDGEIAPECRKHFFVKAIQYLDRNPSVATLTTNIVDKVFGDRTGHVAKTRKVDGLRCVYTFHEGTVFIRKSAFSYPLYLDIKYGSEGIPVSMKAMDDNYENVYNPNIFINHYPKENKWQDRKDYMNMLSASNIYVVKRIQYPFVFFPILNLAYRLRIHRYKLNDKGLIKSFKANNRQFIRNTSTKRIKCRTVLKSFKEFGMTTF